MGLTAVDTLRQILKEIKETNRLLRVLAGEEPPRPPQPRRY
jgi:hypothetical protein